MCLQRLKYDFESRTTASLYGRGETTLSRCHWTAAATRRAQNNAVEQLKKEGEPLLGAATCVLVLLLSSGLLLPRDGRNTPLWNR
jgi:hypothetical protein